MLLCIFVFMIRRPPSSPRTDTLFPYTTLFRSLRTGTLGAAALQEAWLGIRFISYKPYTAAGTRRRWNRTMAELLHIAEPVEARQRPQWRDRKSTRLNSSH